MTDETQPTASKFEFGPEFVPDAPEAVTAYRDRFVAAWLDSAEFWSFG